MWSLYQSIFFPFSFIPFVEASTWREGGRPTKVATVTVNGEAPSDITKGRSITGAPLFRRALPEKQRREKESRTDFSNFWWKVSVQIEFAHSDWNDYGIGGEKQMSYNMGPKKNMYLTFLVCFLSCASCLFALKNTVFFSSLCFADRSRLPKLNIKQNKEKHTWQRALFTAVDHFTFYIYICICSWAESLSFLSFFWSFNLKDRLDMHI